MENSAHGYSEGSEQEYEKPPGYDHYKLTIDLMLEKKELKKELASLKEENAKLKSVMENNNFKLPPAAVFNLQQIALADDEMVKQPRAAEQYRFIARHILELFKK